MTNSLLFTTFESAIFGGIGYVYATQMKLPVNLTASIFVLSRVADRVIQELGKALADMGNLRGTDLPRTKSILYIATNILVNASTIMALRHFDLIALRGALLLSSLAYVNVIHLLTEI